MSRYTRSRRIVSGGIATGAAIILAFSSLPAASAQSAFPGRDGRIAYVGYDGNDHEIFTVRSGGGG